MKIKILKDSEALGKQAAEDASGILKKVLKEKRISNMYPASMLQNHSRCLYYFDIDSASLLAEK